MRKFICAAFFILFFITCKKSSENSQTLHTDSTGTNQNASDTNTSLIGKWQLLSYQSDGGSGDVSWHPADTVNNGFIIFTSDSLIFDMNVEKDTALYKITGPGVIYLFRGVDSFRLVYHSSATLLYFSGAYCSEACGERFVPVH